MELHFYPGQHLLLVRRAGHIRARYEAWGGPAAKGSDPRMAEEPTWPGTYYIHSIESYRTDTWPMSRIRWGTALQDKAELDDVWYRLRNGAWASVRKDHGISRTEILRAHQRTHGTLKIPATWIFNDFGPLAIRWFRDLNGNRQLDRHESLSGQMFHTTPDNEAEHQRRHPVRLLPSHGCIHLKPADRDELIAMGAFAARNVFTVYRNDERFKH